jgi:outer membrane protein assembly factor BamB
VSGGRLRPLLRSRRVRAIAVVLVLAVAGAALGGYLYERARTGNIYHPHARFVPQATPTLPGGRERFSWPIYGYTQNHTRFFPAPSFVRPPFKQLWVHNANALLEFPPVIDGDHIFQLADDAVLSAINIHTGHTFWTAHLGKLSASTPAATSDAVYATILKSGHPHSPGRIVALDYHTGKVLWFRSLPSPSESSPMLDDGKLFFGSQNGTVYALSAHDGHVLWTYHASGSVKASPTLSGHVLYFGDYSGHVQAISEYTGKRIWRTSSEGSLFGSGTFYSTAAVVYGRVFLGNTDGRVYAYDAASGKLDWAIQTGAFVYASPAVTNAPGLGPTIYLGSYNSDFYAINARTGHISWKFKAGGRISGSATIVGNVVYFADLGEHRTYGLGISTGRLLFRKETGAFDPVISDGKDLYLTGYTGLFGLAPIVPAKTPATSTAATKAKAKAGASCTSHHHQKHGSKKSAPRSAHCQPHASAQKSSHHTPARHSRSPKRASSNG